MNPIHRSYTHSTHATHYRASSQDVTRLTFRRANGGDLFHVRLDIDWRDTGNKLPVDIDIEWAMRDVPSSIKYAVGSTVAQMLRDQITKMIKDPRWTTYRLQQTIPMNVMNVTGTGLAAEFQCSAYPHASQWQGLCFMREELPKPLAAWADPKNAVQFRRELGAKIRQVLGNMGGWPAQTRGLVNQYEKSWEADEFLRKESL